MRRTSGFFFIVLLQLAFLLAFLYMGLNMVERGTQQLIGLAEEGRALCFNEGERGLVITFAGRDYVLPWKQFWADVTAYYFELRCRYLD